MGGDLLSGSNNTYFATLVERQTRYVMLAKVAGKEATILAQHRCRRSRQPSSQLG